jgi:hypothetical protein
LSNKCRDGFTKSKAHGYCYKPCPAADYNHLRFGICSIKPMHIKLNKTPVLYSPGNIQAESQKKLIDDVYKKLLN